MPGNNNRSGPSPAVPLTITLQRGGRLTLAEQIHNEMQQAIADGRLAIGARLPSCRDLAVQLGVARGTVRAAYDRLVDGQLLVSKGAAGTWVSGAPSSPARVAPAAAAIAPLAEMVHAFDAPPLTFQMGAPASDAFPAKVWSRIISRHARLMASQPMGYADPRGSPALRQQLASYLAIARGMHCQPGQILITNGYAGALGLIVQGLRLAGQQVWLENPGYLLARRALALAGVQGVAVPVDEQGICLDEGLRLAPEARVALVTPGQHAPLGMTLSPARRRALLDWAQRQQGWIIEDDYLGELQLQGRAAPALAALDGERVLHVGTFSKNLSPTLRLGYLVVPEALAATFGEVAALLMPASSAVLHQAVAEFLHEGHFMRHLRRMKRLYAERLALMLEALAPHFSPLSRAALSVVIDLPPGTCDTRIAREALRYGMAPSPLSMWYQESPAPRSGLVLSVTTLPRVGYAESALRLKQLVEQFG